VLLGCERSGKYRKYRSDLEVTITGTRKCDCPFRLRGKPIKGGEGWVLKVVCGLHNHDLAETLVVLAPVDYCSDLMNSTK